jgi:ankyrin repeat protein
VNDKDSYNGTGLIRAAERGHARIVKRLLRAGIDKDHVNRLGWTAAEQRGYEDITRILRSAGAHD